LDLERLRTDRPARLLETVWIARGGGNRPFYCFAMEAQCGRVRIRFDPLCMRPASECRGTVEAVEAVLDSYSSRIEFAWKRRSMLVIDNWRCLHARGDGAADAPTRLLRRWSIGVPNGLVA
jgi:hypothetical protein